MTGLLTLAAAAIVIGTLAERLLAAHGRISSLRWALEEANARADRADAAQAQITQRAAAAQALATHAGDQRDAAVRDHADLLDRVRALADALDQGAHRVAAARLRSLADQYPHHNDGQDTR